MANQLPRVRRVGGGDRLAWFLAVTIAVLVGVIVFLVLGSPMLDDEPQSDAERDYMVLQQALAKDPKNAPVMMTLAEAEYQLGKTQDALAHAKKAVELGGEQPGLRVRLATLLVQEGQLKEAKQALDEEIKSSNGSDAEPFFLLAQIQAQDGDTAAGLKTMDKALEINPMAADMRAVYASMLEEEGRKKDAIAQYKQALVFLPGDPGIIEALERLGVKIDAKTAADPHAALNSEGSGK